MAYRMLPVSDLPNVDFPTIRGQRHPARREPRDDGVVGRDAAGEAVLDHRRPRLDDLDQHARARPASRCSSTLDRNIDAAAQDVQSAIAAAQSQLPPGMPTPPSYRKVNPADSPVLYLALSSTDAAALAGRRVRRDLPGRAHLDGQRRGAGAGVRLAEVRRAHPARSARRWPRAASASTKSRRRSRAPTSICRPARSTARTRRSPCRPTAS